MSHDVTLDATSDGSDNLDPRAHPSRRSVLTGAAAAVVSMVLPPSAFALQSASAPSLTRTIARGDSVNMLTVKDGTSIYYKDWGTGQPIVFSHGWPLSADAWDAQMLFLVQHGFRVIAHDRRGHGRSGQSWNGNDMNTYADDLQELFEKLNLTNAVMVGHSTGGGEVARYLGRHGSKRVAKAVFISAVTPYMVQTADHPNAAPMSVFDGLREGVMNDRSQFFKDLSMPFFGYNRAGARISEGAREQFWLQGMLGSVKSQFDCIKAFSETDFRGDLAKITIPALFLHGDDDQIVPIQIASPLAVKMVKSGTLKVYPGQAHGICTTIAGQVNADLLAFIKA